MATLTTEQYQYLLYRLKSSRISKRSQGGKSLSYLEAWDVKAHLTRIFGFCNWDGEVLQADLAYEDAPTGDSKTWRVGYKVTYQLTIRDRDGLQLCRHTETAVGSGKLPDRGEAHDMAVKTAESDALKRAAINLGTQFGLSLYNNGSVEDVIGQTLVPPPGDAKVAESPAPGLSEPDPEPVDEPSLPDEVLAMFREQATNPNATERIPAIAALKATHVDHLDAMVEVADEGRITLGRLADLIAGGKYVPATSPQGDEDE